MPWTAGQFVLRTRTKAKSGEDYVVGTLMINTFRMKEGGPPQHCGHKNWKQDDVIQKQRAIVYLAPKCQAHGAACTLQGYRLWGQPVLLWRRHFPMNPREQRGRREGGIGQRSVGGHASCLGVDNKCTSCSWWEKLSVTVYLLYWLRINVFSEYVCDDK